MLNIAKTLYNLWIGMCYKDMTTNTHTHIHALHPQAQHQGGCVLICVVAHFSCTFAEREGGVGITSHNLSIQSLRVGSFKEKVHEENLTEFSGAGTFFLTRDLAVLHLWVSGPRFFWGGTVKCLNAWGWCDAGPQATLFSCVCDSKNARNVIILNDIQSIHPNRISSIRYDVGIDFFFISSFLNFLQNISSTKLTGFRTDSISESQNRNLYSAQSSQQVCEFTFWRLSSLQETSRVQSYAIVCVALNSPHSAGKGESSARNRWANSTYCIVSAGFYIIICLGVQKFHSELCIYSTTCFFFYISTLQSRVQQRPLVTGWSCKSWPPWKTQMWNSTLLWAMKATDVALTAVNLW